MTSAKATGTVELWYRTDDSCKETDIIIYDGAPTYANSIQLFLQNNYPEIKLYIKTNYSRIGFIGRKRLLSSVFYNVVMNSVEAIIPKSSHGEIVIQLFERPKNEKIH